MVGLDWDRLREPIAEAQLLAHYSSYQLVVDLKACLLMDCGLHGLGASYRLVGEQHVVDHIFYGVFLFLLVALCPI